MAYRIDFRLSLPSLFLLALAAVLPTAAAAVDKPPCAALETWAATIDQHDRWQPLEGSRAWLPRAFEGEAFVELFGAPALRWTVEDTREIGAHLNACRNEAGRAKRYAAQKALNAARSYVAGKLKAVLALAARQADRAAQARPTPAPPESRPPTPASVEDRRAQQQRAVQAKRAERDQADIRRALDELLAEPDSPALLRTLAVLRAVDVTDRASYVAALGQVGNRAGRNLLQTLYRSRANLTDPEFVERVDARAASLHDAVIAERLGRIEAIDASRGSIRALSELWRELTSELGPALTKADREVVGKAIGAKRTAIQETVAARAKELIDRSPDDAEGLRRVDAIVENTEKAIGLSPQLMEVRRYARARKGGIGAAALAAATKRLETFPATLKGLHALRRFAIDAAKTFGPYATKEVGERYRTAAVARITEVARGALPAFQGELAALPENDEGLRQAGKRIESARAMAELAEEVRDAYVTAATERRDAIDAAIGRALAERRRAALAAGGDPDVAGYTFVEPETGSSLEFRDEHRVFIAIIGLKAAGTYETSGDDVIVEGPHGNMVLAKHGTSLTGMGLTFERQR